MYIRYKSYIMKKLLFSVILAVVMIISTYAKEVIAGGKTHSAMGDYQITTCDQPCIINGQELKAFSVVYKNSPMEVKIVIQKNKKETTYIVTSEKLSVKYVQNNRYFGIGDVINAENLNKDEYFHQKVLTYRQSEKESLRLIAAYFPYLLA